MSNFSTRKWGRKILATVVAGSLALTMPMISTLQPMYVLADGDGATTTTGTGVYDANEDTLTLEGYNFYTVDKVDIANKKLPAASKWIRTNGGEVNLATITKSKVVTFAKTLDLDADNKENFLSVTVPSLKTVSKITYVAAPDSGKTKLQVTIKGESAALDTADALAAVEFRVNNEKEWTPYADVEARLDELGKTGASISVRVKGKGSEAALDKEDNEGKFKEDVVRASAAKVFKLAKKAAGPNVTIDYDNHVATLKKGTEYGTATAAADPASYTTVPDAGLSLALESGAYYGVRTAAKGKKAASNATTVYVPATTELASTGISVEVATNAAILKIETPATDTYQYTLLTEDAYGKVVETVDGSKCYKGSFATEKTNKNSYKWSSLKGKSVKLEKTIKFAKNTTPTRLLVRKAGNKKSGVYSTTIVVFKLTEDGWEVQDGSLSYGGSTAAGDSGTTTATATATVVSMTTTSGSNSVAYNGTTIFTIVLEPKNADISTLSAADFSTSDFTPTGTLTIDTSYGVKYKEIDDGKIELKVKVANNANGDEDAEQCASIQVKLPTALGGKTVTATFGA